MLLCSNALQTTRFYLISQPHHEMIFAKQTEHSHPKKAKTSYTLIVSRRSFLGWLLKNVWISFKEGLFAGFLFQHRCKSFELWGGQSGSQRRHFCIRIFRIAAEFRTFAQGVCPSMKISHIITLKDITPSQPADTLRDSRKDWAICVAKPICQMSEVTYHSAPVATLFFFKSLLKEI